MKAFAVFLIFSLQFVEIALSKEVTIGSKKFTESVLLGEVLRLGLVEMGTPTKHIEELGGTRILWNALIAGNIDAYPEYTSTIQSEILKKSFRNHEEMRAELKQLGIGISAPLGFNNTYAVGMLRARARELNVRKISDLKNHPKIKIGWSDEFRRRSDGWPGLKEIYNLPQMNTRGLDHDIGYRALQSGDIDIKDLYSTDAEIQYYDISVLQDDLGFFPRYDAVVLYRIETVTEWPGMKDLFSLLEGRISEEKMISMNRLAKVDRVPPETIATNFLAESVGIGITKNKRAQEKSIFDRILLRSKEHLYLVILSLTLAIFAAIPLGVLAAKNALTGKFIIWIAGGIQTIPSMALLVALIKPLNMLGLTGIGDTPALIALFLYSLLPVVRGTHTGLEQIPLSLKETSAVLNLSQKTKLLRIELPLALPSILSGIKTAAVMNVGFATLGALIGAGGYGQPILAGIRLDDYQMILEGAIPSAFVALAIQQLFEIAERFLVSPGLRK